MGVNALAARVERRALLGLLRSHSLPQAAPEGRPTPACSFDCRIRAARVKSPVPSVSSSFRPAAGVVFDPSALLISTYPAQAESRMTLKSYHV